MERDKWLEYLIHYANSKELLPCPDCGKDEVEARGQMVNYFPL